MLANSASVHLAVCLAILGSAICGCAKPDDELNATIPGQRDIRYYKNGVTRSPFGAYVKGPVLDVQFLGGDANSLCEAVRAIGAVVAKHPNIRSVVIGFSGCDVDANTLVACSHVAKLELLGFASGVNGLPDNLTKLAGCDSLRQVRIDQCRVPDANAEVERLRSVLPKTTVVLVPMPSGEDGGAQGPRPTSAVLAKPVARRATLIGAIYDSDRWPDEDDLIGRVSVTIDVHLDRDDGTITSIDRSDFSCCSNILAVETSLRLMKMEDDGRRWYVDLQISLAGPNVVIEKVTELRRESRIGGSIGPFRATEVTVKRCRTERYIRSGARLTALVSFEIKAVPTGLEFTDVTIRNSCYNEERHLLFADDTPDNDAYLKGLRLMSPDGTVLAEQANDGNIRTP